MELVYLWIEDYKNIKRQGFTFSPRFKCEFKPKYNEKDELIPEKSELIIEEKKDYVNIFPDNINVTAIVGKNGAGKSSVLETIFKHFNEEVIREGLICCNKNNLEKNIMKMYSTLEEKKLKIKNKQNNNTIKINKNNECDNYKVIIFNDYIGFSNDHFFTNNELPLKANISYMAKLSKFVAKESINYNEHILNNAYFFIRTETYKNHLKIMNEKYLPDDFSKPEYVKLNFNEIKLLLKFLKNKKILDNEKNEKIIENIFQKNKKLDCCILEILLSCDKDKIKNLIDNLNNKNYIYHNCECSEFYKKKYEIKKKKDIKKLIKLIDVFQEKIGNFLKLCKNIKEEKFKLGLLIDIYYKKNGEGVVLSSGEYSLLTILGDLKDEIENAVYINEQNKDKINIKNFFLLLDEIENNLHPDWNKRLIKILIEFMNTNYDNAYSFHIILATHSPFILSDLPKENIIFMKEGRNVSDEVEIETFGANIHTLLTHGFFMEDGLMGEYAKEKINDVINYIRAKKEKIKLQTSIKDDKEAEYIINSIGEPFLREKLRKMLYSTIENEEERIKKQIKDLERKLEELKSKK